MTMQRASNSSFTVTGCELVPCGDPGSVLTPTYTLRMAPSATVGAGVVLGGADFFLIAGEALLL